MGPIRSDPSCPTVLTVACCEAGDLTDIRGAAVKAHARRCPHCGQVIDALGRIRGELLGSSSRDRAAACRRAAEAILGMLRSRPTPSESPLFQ